MRSSRLFDFVVHELGCGGLQEAENDTDKRTGIACFLNGELPDNLLRDLCAGGRRLALEALPQYVQKYVQREVENHE